MLAVLLFSVLMPCGRLEAQNGPKPDKEKIEEVFVPSDHFGEILKRHPGGFFLTPREYQRLVGKAHAFKPFVQRVPEAVPENLVVQDCQYEAVFHPQDRTLTVVANAQLKVLAEGWQTLSLPLGGLQLGQVKLNGKAAQLIMDFDSIRVLVKGPATHTLTLEFSVKVARLPNSQGGQFGFELLPATAAQLKMTVPGRAAVKTQPATLQTQALEGKTAVTVTLGGHKALKMSFRPEEMRVRKKAYVIAEKATCYELSTNVITLKGQVQLKIHRQKLDEFQLLMPAGFTMRTLTALPAPSWVQDGPLVTVNLPEAQSGQYQLKFTAERAVKIGELTLNPVRVPTAARETGLVGFVRTGELKLQVLAEEGLKRRNLDAQSRQALARKDLERVYSETPRPYALKLKTRAIEAQVDLELTSLQEYEAHEIRNTLIMRYMVREGSIFSVSAKVPEGYDIANIEVWTDKPLPPAHDLRIQDTDAGKDILVELEKGVSAGHHVRIVATLQHAVPEGLKTLKSLTVPVFAGSPANSTRGYIGFAVTPEYNLVAESIQGLTGVPAEELVKTGITHTHLALGYRVDGSQYSGQFRLKSRAQRLSAETFLRHNVADQVISTLARVQLDSKGAPCREVVFYLPKGKSKQVFVDGVDIKERGAIDRKTPQENWEAYRVRFVNPMTGRFTLFLQFDTNIPAFDQTGAASTDIRAPFIHVADVERESGVIAVFSSDSTKISAKAKGLRPVEVTAVPKMQRGQTIGRPLTAYNYVRPEYDLSFVIERYDFGELLTALCEKVTLSSSVGVDGTVHHTAEFRLKNLSHQFLALALPPESELWSVSADKVGLKPALLATGEHIIPLPQKAAAKRDPMVVLKVVYEQKNSGLENGRRAKLKAPALMIPQSEGNTPVPVMNTEWVLAVPEDNNVVTLRGNLNNIPLLVDRTMAGKIWRLLGHWWKRGLGQLLMILAGAVVLLYLFVQFMGKPFVAWANDEPGRWKTLALVVLGLLVTAVLTSFLFSLVSGRAQDSMSGNVAMEADYKTAAKPQAPMLSEESADKDDAYEGKGNLNYTGATLSNSDPDDSLLVKKQESLRRELERVKDMTKRQQKQELSRRFRKEGRGDKAAYEKKKYDRKPSQRPRKRRSRKWLPKSKRPQRPAPPKAEPTPVRDPRGNFAKGESRRVLLANKDTVPSNIYKPAGGKYPGASSGQAGQGGAGGGGGRGYVDRLKRMLDEELGVREGLRSMILRVAPVGKVTVLNRRGGEAWVELKLMHRSRSQWLAFFSILIGFGLAFFVPAKSRFNYLGLLGLSLGLGTVLSLAFEHALVASMCNGLIGGVMLAGPVQLFIYGAQRFSEWRQSSHASRPSIRVLPAALLVCCLLPSSSAMAAPDKPVHGPRVFRPYDSNSMNPQDRIYVPRDLFKQLMAKAYPKPVNALAIPSPTNFSFSRVHYAADLQGQDLNLVVEVEVQVLKAWSEVPLGLKGAGIRTDRAKALTIEGGPKGAKPRIRQSQRGLSAIFEQPGSYKITVQSLVSKNGGRFAFHAVPSAASSFLLSTGDLKNRILINGNRFGQVDRIDGQQRQVSANLGRQRQVEISVTAPEVMSVGGSSDASARNLSVFYIEPGVVRVRSEVSLDVVGTGWEGFRFTIPKDLAVVRVVGVGLREWRTLESKNSKERVLELMLRQARAGVSRFTIEAEWPIPKTASQFQLPEIQSMGVDREHGLIGLVPSAGLKTRCSTTGALYQISRQQASDLKGLMLSSSDIIDSAFEYGRRPTRTNIEFVQEQTQFKSRTRLQATLSKDSHSWQTSIDFNVMKGQVYELAFMVPEGLECQAIRVNKCEVRDWRSETIDGLTVVACNLNEGLSGRFTCTLQFSREGTTKINDFALPKVDAYVLERNPKVHLLGPSRDEGRVVLAVRGGLDLLSQGNPEGFEAVDVGSEQHWLSLNKQTDRAVLAYSYRQRQRSGRFQVKELSARVNGAFTLHAHVFHEVVRYRVHMAFEISRSSARQFSFLLPARFGDKVDIQAPNKRELRVEAVEFHKQQRMKYTVELQSAVKGLYELTFELEELAAKDGTIAFPAIAIPDVDRSRGYILIEKDARVEDELVRDTEKDRAIANIQVSQVPALPPGRSPSSFLAAYKVQQPPRGLADWNLVYTLKKVKFGEGPAAIIDWVQFTTVIHENGRVQNSARYRIRNRRLQFLTLSLPKEAQIWSVVVANETKRIYSGADNQVLVPLPKRIEADLSFDVELVFETSLGKALAYFTEVQPQAPQVSTVDLAPEQSFWSVYLPKRFQYFDFDSNMDIAVEAQKETKAAERWLDELSQLADVAKKEGQTGEIAQGNLDQALRRAKIQIDTAISCQTAVESKAQSLSDVQSKLVLDNRSNLKEVVTRFKNLQRTVNEDRRVRLGKKGQRQGRQAQSNRQLKQKYARSDFNDWALNKAVLKGNKAQWDGLEDQEQKQQLENLVILSANNAKVQQQLSQTLTTGKRLGGQARKKLSEVYRRERQRRVQANESLEGYEQQDMAQQGQQGMVLINGVAGLDGKPNTDFSYTINKPGPGNDHGRGKSKAMPPDLTDRSRRGVLSMRVAIERMGEGFHFEKTHGKMTLKFRAVPKSFIASIQSWIQWLAVIALLALMPALSVFKKNAQAGLWTTVGTLGALLAGSVLISMGWLESLPVLAISLALAKSWYMTTAE